eukprot:gene12385-biopygen2203
MRAGCRPGKREARSSVRDLAAGEGCRPHRPALRNVGPGTCHLYQHPAMPSEKKAVGSDGETLAMTAGDSDGAHKTGSGTQDQGHIRRLQRWNKVVVMGDSGEGCITGHYVTGGHTYNAWATVKGCGGSGRSRAAEKTDGYTTHHRPRSRRD